MTPHAKPRFPSPLPNWNGTAGLRLQGADPGLSDQEDCKHEFRPIGRCRDGRRKCHRCGMILVETTP